MDEEPITRDAVFSSAAAVVEWEAEGLWMDERDTSAPLFESSCLFLSMSQLVCSASARFVVDGNLYLLTITNNGFQGNIGAVIVSDD